MSEGPIEWIRQHVPAFCAYGRSRLGEADRGTCAPPSPPDSWPSSSACPGSSPWSPGNPP